MDRKMQILLAIIVVMLYFLLRDITSSTFSILHIL